MSNNDHYVVTPGATNHDAEVLTVPPEGSIVYVLENDLPDDQGTVSVWYADNHHFAGWVHEDFLAPVALDGEPTSDEYDEAITTPAAPPAPEPVPGTELLDQRRVQAMNYAVAMVMQPHNYGTRVAVDAIACVQIARFVLDEELTVGTIEAAGEGK